MRHLNQNKSRLINNNLTIKNNFAWKKCKTKERHRNFCFNKQTNYSIIETGLSSEHVLCWVAFLLLCKCPAHIHSCYLFCKHWGWVDFSEIFEILLVTNILDFTIQYKVAVFMNATLFQHLNLANSIC